MNKQTFTTNDILGMIGSDDHQLKKTLESFFNSEVFGIFERIISMLFRKKLNKTLNVQQLNAVKAFIDGEIGVVNAHRYLDLESMCMDFCAIQGRDTDDSMEFSRTKVKELWSLVTFEGGRGTFIKVRLSRKISSEEFLHCIMVERFFGNGRGIDDATLMMNKFSIMGIPEDKGKIFEVANSITRIEQRIRFKASMLYDAKIKVNVDTKEEEAEKVEQLLVIESNIIKSLVLDIKETKDFIKKSIFQGRIDTASQTIRKICYKHNLPDAEKIIREALHQDRVPDYIAFPQDWDTSIEDNQKVFSYGGSYEDNFKEADILEQEALIADEILLDMADAEEIEEARRRQHQIDEEESDLTPDFFDDEYKYH